MHSSFDMYADDVVRRQKIGNLLKEIHFLIPKQNINFSKVGVYEVREGFLNGRKIKRLIIYMRSHGCEWMLNNPNGGCTMCGHLVGTARGRVISAESYKKQFDDIISNIYLGDISMICIYNAGSFLNDKEMHPEVREYIYRKLGSIKSIETIIFESRPEYLSYDKLETMRALLPNQRIEIGIGLETTNDYIRRICLNKGFSLKEFEKVIPLLKRYNIKILAYVLQKPPFVNEKLAIDDAILSIDWAFKNGVDVVSLEPVSIQRNTLVHLLYSMNLYRTPWIWSVLSVIKGVSGKGLVRIGGFEFFPPPDIYTHNCSSCNDVCIQAISLYNATNDVAIIEEALSYQCADCKEIWLKELEDSSRIQDNIDLFLYSYNKEILYNLYGHN